MQLSETIRSCRICASEKLVEFLDLGDQPPANSLRKDRSEVLPAVPLKLVFCEACSTVQLSDTVNPEYLFDHYVWVTGTSKTAVEYSDLFCKRVMSRLPAKQDGGAFVVEVASNDGTFLQRFQQAGCRVQGVDPARNIAEIAVARGVPTLNSFFNLDVAKTLRADQGPAGAVIARNVISHVKEIHSIIAGMAHLIEGGGTGVIEFHYLGKILDELHYDSVYHEHLFYFSLKTLGQLLQQYGLKIFDVEQSPISGGSLVIYFSMTETAKSAALVEIEEYETRVSLNALGTWQEFAASSIAHASKLKSMVKSVRQEGVVAGFGASARSSTLLNFCSLSKADIDFIFDNNPLKQGLITPGSNIEIVPFQINPDALKDVAAVVILAWNFGAEIEGLLRSAGYTGPIIMPLPNDPTLTR